MGTAPLSFTGLSTFSNDFQSILTRTLAIAQLPIKALQNQQADLLQKKTVLVSLNAAVADVGGSIAALGVAGAKKGLVASSSDSTKVSVVNSGADSAASYSISEITSIASAASETSAAGYATSDSTPVSSTGSLSLVLGTNSVPITLGTGKNNLAGLRDAINAAGAGVTASILTTGTGANPNYLTISSNTTGQTTLQLNDIPSSGPPVNLLTSANQGSNAVFKLNGVNVSRTTNAVNNVVPGLTFNILDKTAAGQTVNLSLSPDRTELGKALQNFSDKYNVLTDQVNAQVGPAAGLLSGDFLIRQVQGDLHQATSYQGTNSIKGLATLGVTLDATGKSSFDQTALDGLTDSQLSDAFSFLGSASSGFGALASSFAQLSDPATGFIRSQENGYDQTNHSLTGRITTLTDRASQVQASTTSRLQAADALLAKLQSQQQVLTASVQAVDLTLFGKGFASSGS